MPPWDERAHTDLTGAWHGQYSLPQSIAAPVPFEASLIATEDVLGGSITERATEGRAKGRILYASVSGSRSGQQVRFVKTYEADSDPYTSVTYAGAVSGDGQEISGDWTIGRWSGRFLMIRAGGVAKTASRRIHEMLHVPTYR
jgi:hypothetical protein